MEWRRCWSCNEWMLVCPSDLNQRDTVSEYAKFCDVCRNPKHEVIGFTGHNITYSEYDGDTLWMNDALRRKERSEEA